LEKVWKKMTTKIERSALVAYSQAQMFALVEDIESYPQFMDGCIGAEVKERSGDIVTASLTLSQAGIRQSFTTRNTLRRPEAMQMELVEGPFSTFNGVWSFQFLAQDACKVLLELEFGFRSRMVQAASSRMFESVANQQVASLCRRAEGVYGKTNF